MDKNMIEGSPAEIDFQALTDSIDELDLEMNLELEEIEELDTSAIEALDVEEIDERSEAVIEAAAVRDEIYASAAPGEELVEPSEPAALGEPPVKAVKERKAREPKAAKEPKAPKVERALVALPDALFVLDEEAPEDLAANKLAVLAMRPTQKKIAEKFDNFFAALHANRQPSVYTMLCYRALAATGKATMKDLVAALSITYSIGTARSQAGQIANLFKTLRIAHLVGGEYHLNESSPLAGKLKALASLPA